MTLQQIINNYQKKSWLRLCTLHDINKWDLISYVKESVYASKYLIKPELKVSTNKCLCCGKMFDLGIHLSNFIIIRNCKCGSNGKNDMTYNKLICIFDDLTARLALTIVNKARKKGLPNTIEYWENSGNTLEEAIENVKKVQIERSLKSPASKKGARGFSVRTNEYWIKKGFTEQEAILKIKQIQTTNGLSYYISKYGSEGEGKFNERIAKWLDSPGNKNMIKGRSKRSNILFEQLGKGFFGKNEKTVRGLKKVHRVDYIIDNKIIEFFGDYWHGNPNLYKSGQMIRNKPIEMVWEHDRKKIEDLCASGYCVMIVWEEDYLKNPELVTSKCKEFIK